MINYRPILQLTGFSHIRGTWESYAH